MSPPLLKRGETVLSCPPFAHALMAKERGIRCDECFRIGSLRDRTLNRCSKCKVAHYCSLRCQKAAWAVHKAECEGFGRVSPEVPSESVRLLGRLVIKWLKGLHLVVEENKDWPASSRCFSDLKSHVEDILANPAKAQQFVIAWETLRAFLGKDFLDQAFPGDPRAAVQAMGEGMSLDSLSSSSPSSILVGAAIFGRMTVNSFSILDSECRPIGVGVYLAASRFDHTCDGNVIPRFDGTRLTIALRDNNMPRSFSSLSLCYCDQLAPTWERRSSLASQYFFNCSCTWCQPTVVSHFPYVCPQYNLRRRASSPNQILRTKLKTIDPSLKFPFHPVTSRC